MVTPVLPGDSLLFAAGALWRPRASSIPGACAPCSSWPPCSGTWSTTGAAIISGPASSSPTRASSRREYLDTTNAFYAKYGPKTIVIARFVPFVRTFAPFVAGMGRMQYRRFFFYNVTGAVLWVVVCTVAGYFFGNIQAVKKNFSLVILGHHLRLPAAGRLRLS